MKEDIFEEKLKKGEIEIIEEVKKEEDSFTKPVLEDYISLLEDLRRSKLTQIQKTDLTDGGTTTLHSHAAAGLEYVSIDPPAGTYVVTANTWEDWDLSASCPAGAKYVEIMIGEDSGVARVCGIRKNGTAVDRTITAYANSLHTQTVELDANRVIERYSDSNAAVEFKPLGYWK